MNDAQILARLFWRVDILRELRDRRAITAEVYADAYNDLVMWVRKQLASQQVL